LTHSGLNSELAHPCYVSEIALDFSSFCLFLFFAPVLHHFLNSLGKLGVGAQAVNKDRAAFQRGDLTIDITAVGNLAFSYQEELIFEVGRRVSEILVEIGDSMEVWTTPASATDKANQQQTSCDE
jgi:hypothetical protein